MGTLYWEDVAVGQELPPFVRKTGFMEWNRFAAANEEFVPFHMDDEEGRATGQHAAYGMGNLRYAYLHNLVLDWIGLDGSLRKLGVQYRGLNFKNDVLVCTGKVKDKYVREGQHYVELDLAVLNQKGENTCPGTALVVLPSRG